MAKQEVSSKATKKRKNAGAEDAAANSKRRAVASTAAEAEQAKIEELENQIAESRKHYNNIATLLSMLNVGNGSKKPNLPVAVALCRVFSRLIAGGYLKVPKGATEQEEIVVAWLKERLQEYQKALLQIIRHADSSSQITAFTLCMRLNNVRAKNIPGSETQAWTTGFFANVFEALIEADGGDALRDEFMKKYVLAHEDIRYYTFVQIATYAASERDIQVLERLISILSQCDSVPAQDHQFGNFFTTPERKENGKKNPLFSVNAHKKRAQDAWLAVLRNSLSESQRKALLRLISPVIARWFQRPELLMDFLTDSYNVGGSTSLLALSGLFYLIQEKNLDYPQFYTKLYSLLDADLLHSKHRSRFFRLMDTFLGSSHLPVTLVASFIKRLARLALNAPPTAIVTIVPFIYNLLKNHPTCTFMLHREIRDEAWKADIEADGFEDPFDPDEPDPTQTDAIESCLWEIETLQSHYHPNVAAIARIISEQFTKPSYNLEDFLDYTYQGMTMTELGAEEKPSFKKPPVVEFFIPKRIFTGRLLDEDGGVDTAPGSMLRELWDFS